MGRFSIPESNSTNGTISTNKNKFYVRLSELPDNYRTKIVKGNYDRNNDGVIEISNDPKTDEANKILKSFGLNLKNYKPSIFNVKHIKDNKNHDTGYDLTRCYNQQGQLVGEVRIHQPYKAEVIFHTPDEKGYYSTTLFNSSDGSEQAYTIKNGKRIK